MTDSKGTALAALRLLFRPVARIMLRAGINWRELADVCKATYVEVATEDFGIRGRPTNISRVAILTGLTRKEVRRLRDLLEEASPEVFSRMNFATRVLSGWHQDEEFLDAEGKPRPLPREGASGSFESLCHRYSPPPDPEVLYVMRLPWIVASPSNRYSPPPAVAVLLNTRLPLMVGEA